MPPAPGPAPVPVDVTTRQRLPADRCFARYRNDRGEFTTVELAPDVYNALLRAGTGEPDPAPRLPPGRWTWIMAWGGAPTFDTADGDLHAGDFFAGDGTCQAVICVREGKLGYLEPADIVTREPSKVTLTAEAYAVVS